MGQPIGRDPLGEDVLDAPPTEVGIFYTYMLWTMTLMTVSAFNSARGAGVFLRERLGPKGGWWYAVASAEAWTAWAQGYRRRKVARVAGDAARRLGRAP